MLETIGSLDEMTEAVGAAREACDLPIVASMTFAEDGRTIGGSSPEEVAARLYEFGVAAIGANCSVGPQRLLPVAEALVRHLGERDGAVPAVSCMPNAGWPAHVAGASSTLVTGVLRGVRPARPRRGAHHRRLLRHHSTAHGGDA